MRKCLFGLLLFISWSSQAQMPSSSTLDFILTKDDAFLLDSPKMIVNDIVTRVEHSPDGRFLLIWTMDFEGHKISDYFAKGATTLSLPTSKLMIWDSKSDKSYTAKVAKANVEQMVQPTWSSDSKQAYFVLTDYTDQTGGDPISSSQVMRISLLDGGCNPIFQTQRSQDWSYVTVQCSPVKPLMVIFQMKQVLGSAPLGPKQKVAKLTVCDLLGNPLRQWSDSLKGYLYDTGEWNTDGSKLHITVFSEKDGPNPAKQQNAVFDTSTGRIFELKEHFDPYEATQRETKFEIEQTTSTVVSAKKKVLVKCLWLKSTTESEEPKCLVASGFDDAPLLLSEGQKVCYISKGKLYSRAIERVDKEAFIAARDAAARLVVISNVRQIATALMMFAADNDDKLPGSLNFHESTMPYIKNESMLNGFVYTYRGGALGDLKDPSKTELGYVDVAGGRCVAYADSHVKFIKNP